MFRFFFPHRGSLAVSQDVGGEELHRGWRSAFSSRVWMEQFVHLALARDTIHQSPPPPACLTAYPVKARRLTLILECLTTKRGH